MRCSTIRKRIHELLDQRHLPSRDPLVAEHCRGCPCCAEQLQLLEQLETTLRTLPRPEPPPDLARRIVRQVAACAVGSVASPAAPLSQRRWDGLVLAAVVALSLMAMVVIDSLWQPSGSPDSAVVRPDRLQPVSPTASAHPMKQLQENLRQLMTETQLELQQAQLLLPETESRTVQAPPVGTDVLSPMAELVRPLQPVASGTFSTLGTFWSRVTDSVPQEQTAGSPAGPG